jgi:hypothetical protein
VIVLRAMPVAWDTAIHAIQLFINEPQRRR